MSTNFNQLSADEPAHDWEQDTERIAPAPLPWWMNNPFVILTDGDHKRKVRVGDPVYRVLVANGWKEVGK